MLIRTDGAGRTKKLLEWITTRRMSYSIGFTLPENTPDLLALIPKGVWAPALDAHDEVRDGAWVAELTDLMNLEGWPAPLERHEAIRHTHLPEPPSTDGDDADRPPVKGPMKNRG